MSVKITKMSVDSEESNYYARINPSVSPTVPLTIHPPVPLDETVGQPPQDTLTTPTQTDIATFLTSSAAANEKPLTVAYNQMPAIEVILDFTVNTHKYYYNQGCKRCYKNYDVNPEGQYAFVTDLSFKVNKFSWGNDTCDILYIPSEIFDPNRNEIHKFLLEHDSEFNLPFLSELVST